MRIILDKAEKGYDGDIILTERDIEDLLEGKMIEASNTHDRMRLSLGCILRKGLYEEEIDS